MSASIAPIRDGSAEGNVSLDLDDLRQTAAEEEAELAEQEGVVDVDNEQVDPEAAIQALRAEPDDDQPAWGPS
jgi:hypothetical protein